MIQRILLRKVPDGRFESGRNEQSAAAQSDDRLAAAVERRPWLCVALLVLLVVGVYFLRMTHLPVVGEEARWARGAVQMIETGDWIVLRQQGQPFPERPPMSSWAMAVVGLWRGDVDVVAIRLPSCVAILATTLVVFVYARTFLSAIGALAAATMFATMLQVMQIGRMGESEALFTLFVSSSLLLWHLGYLRRWPPIVAWSIGYSLAALGALVKGPQAPVYFVAVTGMYLIVRRNWRWLLSFSHVAGAMCFVAIVGLWQVPYYLMTDWTHVRDTWFGLAGDRFTISGLAKHVVTYPLETLGCLLPWSPLLLLLVRRDFRCRLLGRHESVRFLVISLAVTYPSVWLAAGARGRYFMPLYPCIAVVLGAILEACIVGDDRAERLWRGFVRSMAAFAVIGGLVVLAAAVVRVEPLADFPQPPLFAAVMGAISVCAAIALVQWSRSSDPQHRICGFATIAGWIALAYTGAVINAQAATWTDLGPIVARVRSQIPQPERLVSLGPIDHRFAYAYRLRIREIPWPKAADELPDDVRYFCFTRLARDTPQRRTTGRGRTWWKTPGTLPLAWEEIAVVCCDREWKEHPDIAVVIGRVVRDVPPARSAAASHAPRR